MTTSSPLPRLRLPVIMAPMFLTSTPQMVVAACRAGLMGAIPALNQRSTKGLEDWLIEIGTALAATPEAAPFAVNLIVSRKHNPRLDADLALVVKHRVPVVITAFGAEPEVIAAVQSYGGLVFHDVASRRHAEKIAGTGVDGLIALTSGAGGHTGHLSPFAAVAEVRKVFDGLIILAGAVSSGADIAAARAMGADLVSMGTRFIATQEAPVPEAQKQMMLAAGASDVMVTSRLTGADAAFLRPSLRAVGLDPEALPEPGTTEAKPWRDIWSAGQGVGSIDDIPTIAELAERLRQDYDAALTRLSEDAYRAPAGRVTDLPVIEATALASLHDMGDGVACFRAHSKLNTFDPQVQDMLAQTLERAGHDFAALVLANDDPKAFSAGADLGFFTRMIQSPDGAAQIGAYGRRGQALFAQMRRAPIPVVAAVHGFALGGGCEFQMHADATIAHDAALIGLPEAGIGLVPGWGGCTQLYLRLSAAAPDLGPVEVARRCLSVLFAGRILPAAEARGVGLLRPTDGILGDRAGLAAAAKARALALLPGYAPPQELRLPMPRDLGEVLAALPDTPDQSPTDRTLAQALAAILVDPSGHSTEAQIMAREVETLAHLVQQAPVQARIAHMLATGQRLKN